MARDIGFPSGRSPERLRTVEHYELTGRKYYVDGMWQRAIARELGYSGKFIRKVLKGRRACRLGYRVRFFTAAGLANLYRQTWGDRQVLRFEASLGRVDLIVLHELGYVALDKAAAEHLFGFFGRCHEQRSLIATTHLPFAQWPAPFAGDERLTGALLDRLTHRVHIVEIQGDSYRLKASLKANSKSPGRGGQGPLITEASRGQAQWPG